jgi:hypothetical protein
MWRDFKQVASNYMELLLYGKHHFRWNGGLWLAEKHFQRSIIFPLWTGGPLRKNKRMHFKTKQQN